ncbi:type I restriction endonuclease subunit R [Thermomonospora cellulosilytica]|uniref:Type I restriction enzyme endonuclease subunit n=1 Tax=Thermomonospora cellulosilytica TaxID=1411118 RepID=A0A7W3R724_9ACTN|nr:type I restriction endonuclease subunit R [Thermomonospora cellulosilytica]MBA9002818.1 type I restriction enzyme R subunit [Thermomonospora cellulosilytica]
MTGYSEADLEYDVLDILGDLGWEPLEGKQIAVGSGEREFWEELIIPGRLRAAVAQINPELPASAVDEVVDLVLSPKSQDVRDENKRIHEYLTQGIRGISYVDEFGAEQHPTVHLINRRDPYRNEFLAVRQVMVVQRDERRRFDVVLYVNGLPLAIFELKKMTDERATPEAAHAQLMSYVRDMWQAFRCNVISLVSDGVSARYGTAFTPYNHFAPWNVDEGGEPVQQSGSWEESELSLALHGLFEQRRFIELLNGYVAFAQSDGGPVKRIAKPHQYFAVSKAIGKTIEAVRSNGKAGVVWHTQGSGKSFEMELYSNQVLKHPALGNPTIVVITDRTDLDDQLFENFDASELLPEKPVRVTSREELRTELSNRRTGGIYFTTLQKFSRTKAERDAGLHHPLLSERRNIIVIVDEAHRSHYDDLNGYARHLRQALPYATMIAFTGTPISEADRDTQAVFGDYIDIYDLTRAVEDGATVPVYYESRLIPVELPAKVDPEKLDEEADKATEGLDDAERRRVESASVTLNAVYGAPARLEKLAADIVEHWGKRSEAMKEFIGVPGKGMIVCSTREICAALYRRIIAIKPDWHSDDVNTGKIKVVYSPEQKDSEELRAHWMRPSEHKTVQRRMKDPDNELELIIVKDMLLTGFDAPPLHTLYLDRSMRGAQLMQTLARVNRTFRNKQDGLMVGYAPLHENLLKALAEYTTTDQQTKPMGREVEEAIDKVRDIIEVLGDVLLEGYPWREKLRVKSPTAYRDTVHGAATYVWDSRHPLNQVEENRETREREPTLKERFLREAGRLARFYAVCSTSGKLNDLRDDIAFFRDVRVVVVKLEANRRRAEGRPIPADVELYLKQLTAGAIEAGDVTDLFSEAGLERPDLSHLDDAYIKKFQASKHPALAIEALRRLVQQEMRRVTKHNIVRQQSFSDRLLELMRKYTNQNISAAEVIAQLFELAKEVAADANRGQQFSPALTSDELAFYDAVAAKENVRNLMGDEKLADIARDLVKAVRRNLSTDWTARDDVQAKLRSIIKRLLARHDYPPEEEQDAIDKVIQQLETFADEWAPDADR